MLTQLEYVATHTLLTDHLRPEELNMRPGPLGSDPRCAVRAVFVRAWAVLR